MYLLLTKAGRSITPSRVLQRRIAYSCIAALQDIIKHHVKPRTPTQRQFKGIETSIAANPAPWNPIRSQLLQSYCRTPLV
jgi:hypothetical protein